MKYRICFSVAGAFTRYPCCKATMDLNYSKESEQTQNAE